VLLNDSANDDSNNTGRDGGCVVLSGVVAALWRARTARPLLWWVLALLLYVVAPMPQEWVLLLIVGLGAALTVTVARLRDNARGIRQHAQRGWAIAERLAGAAEDRIRGGNNDPHPQFPAVSSGAAYDPGALLGAVVSVLAAEGIDTNAADGLPACVQLLAWQNITPHPGVSAPTAHTLIRAIRPGPRRRYRAMPPALLAHLVRVVLTLDHALPPHMGADAVEDLIEASAQLLVCLDVAPDNRAGGLDEWPVLAQILTAATGR